MSASRRALHALNRLGYGPRPEDALALHTLGPEAWLAQFLSQQLNPPSPLEIEQRRLQSLDTTALSAGELGLRYREARAAARRQQAQRQAEPAAARTSASAEAEQNPRQGVRQILRDNARLRLGLALDSPAQLQERLVEFWFNHFNVFAGKNAVGVYAGHYERQVIRPHVFGRFRDMLGASARHPAMLIYLDNVLSVGADTAPVRRRPGPPPRAQGLNENYARELMELHTLGVDGGYTQADVTELARMFTGWTVDPRAVGRGDTEVFLFNAARHDRGRKRWLGQDVPVSGQREGEWALDVLARHAATARHLSRKLAQWFVSDTPPAALVDQLAEVFLRTDGDLRAWIQALVQAPAFWSEAHWHAKFKTPYQYLLSALRVLGAQVDDPAELLPWLAQAGMPLYGWQTPDGYATTAATWQGPEALALRVQWASQLAGARPARRWHADTDPTRLQTVLGEGLSAPTRATLARTAPAEQLSLLLASPDFLRC